MALEIPKWYIGERPETRVMITAHFGPLSSNHHAVPVWGWLSMPPRFAPGSNRDNQKPVFNTEEGTEQQINQASPLTEGVHNDENRLPGPWP